MRFEFISDQIFDVTSYFCSFIHEFLFQFHIIDFNKVYFVYGIDFSEVFVDGFNLVFVSKQILLLFLSQQFLFSSCLFIFIKSKFIILVFEWYVDFVLTQLIYILNKLLWHIIHFSFDVKFNFVQFTPDCLVFDEFLLIPCFKDQIWVLRQLITILLEISDFIHDLFKVIFDTWNVWQEIDLHFAWFPVGSDLDEDPWFLLGPVATNRLLEFLHGPLHWVRNGS